MERELKAFNSLKKKLQIGSIVMVSMLSIAGFQNCGQYSPASDYSLKPAGSAYCKSSPSDPACGTQAQAQKVTGCTFNGVSLASGQSVTAFLNSSEPYGGTCTSQIRTCNKGVLSGSYAYASCKVAAPAVCLFNGMTIAHGASVPAFQNSSVAFGSACVQESRSCNNGVLSGSYQFGSCQVGAPASCLFNGQTYAHGTSVMAYQSSSVPYGSTCQSEVRTCFNGSMSGTAEYASCAMSAPKSCLFNGQTVAHQQSVTAFTTSSVPYGFTCSPQSRTCLDGFLTGTGEYASCTSTAPRSCLFNGQTVPHGTYVYAYWTSSVPYGSTCPGSPRYCRDGVLDGSGNYSSCTVQQAQSCYMADRVVKHGETVMAYNSNTVIYPSTCTGTPRTCNNGTLSPAGGNYSFCQDYMSGGGGDGDGDGGSGYYPPPYSGDGDGGGGYYSEPYSGGGDGN